MPSTRYYTVNGRILGEKTTGGSRIDYVRDGLGSVVATTDSGGNVQNTYRYKPYGGLLSKTGVGVDPRFLWVGQWGYAGQTIPSEITYVRHRTFSVHAAIWLSVDPHYPNQSPYVYVSSSPGMQIDPEGFFACGADCCRPAMDDYFKENQGKCKKGSWVTCSNQDILKHKCEQLDARGCNKLLEYLLDAARLCVKGCGSEDGNPGDYDWHAATFCCTYIDVYTGKARSKFCGTKCCSGNKNDWENGGAADACRGKCILEHENRHGNDCTRRPKKDNDGNWQPDSSECCGFYVQTMCILKFLKAKCPGTSVPPEVQECENLKGNFKCQPYR